MKKVIIILFAYAAAAVHAAQQPQLVDLEIGQLLNLEAFNGPNVSIVVTSADWHEVSFVTIDFDRMKVVVSGGNGGSQPTKTRQQVAVSGEATLLFRRGGVAVLYVGSARMNHVTLGIVTE